ncbi:MAG: GNAT family N-acetyltransferase [Candidatus Thorarchaeota archaeon]
MADQSDIEIVEYSDDLAADIAEMFNSWDDLWPGGFTQGVPYDEERVKKTYGKMSSIALLYALDKATNKPVGMCTLHQHWRDKDAAYVGTLGVSPDSLNKKVGKRLLLRAIDIVVKDGYKRVDLNTWPGNMRAVPLYKKVGLMWNPTGDGVQMEDYIPGILNEPFCQPFFSNLPSDSNWYDFHTRDLIQAPDDFTEEGMEIFPYRFDNGEDDLSVTIDKHSRAITGLERTVDGSRLKITAGVSEHKTLCGVPSLYTLNVENHTTEEIKMIVKLSSFDNLEFQEDSKTTLTIAPGESHEWNVPFIVDSNAPIHRWNVRTPTIDTELNVNGIKSVLSTGLVIKPVAEVRMRLGECRVVPGGKTTVPISIVGSSEIEFDGTFHVESSNESLKASPTQDKISLAPKGVAGFVLTAEAKDSLEAGVHDLWVHFDLHGKPADGKSINLTTRKFRVPVFAIYNGTVHAGEDDRLRRKTILSSQYTASFEYEGAILRVRRPYNLDTNSLTVRTQVGPPFGLDSFRFAKREILESESDDGLIIGMRAQHPERPLLLEDRVTFEKGTGVIVHELWATNTGKEAHTFQARVFGGGGGIGLTPGKVWIPFKDGIVEGKIGDLLFTYPGIPSAPDAYAEGWTASDSPTGVRGQFWDLEELEEIRIGNGQLTSLNYPNITLEPGETKRLTRLWLAPNVPNWLAVRNLWKSRVAKEFDTEITNELLTTRSVYDFESTSSVVPSKQDVELDIVARKAVLAPLPVDINVTPPPGWSVDVNSTGSASLKMHPIQDRETIHLKLTPLKSIPDEFGVFTGSLHIRGVTDTRRQFRFLQVGKTGGSVSIEEAKEQEKIVLTIKNGLIEFKVSPDYGGCLYSLKNDNGTELLVSSFPTAEPKPGGFTENYYGGVQPVLWGRDEADDLFGARTNKERMSGKPIEVGIWKGVEVSWIAKIQESIRDVTLRVQYLTAPNSPLILTRWIVDNTSTAPISIFPSFLIDPAFNGDPTGMIFTTEWEKEMTNIYPTQIPMVSMPTKNFFWIQKGDSDSKNEGLGMIGSGELPKMIGFFVENYYIIGTSDMTMRLLPGESKMVTSCLIVNPKKEEDLIAIQSILDEIV